jgi:hypothetical protein
MIILVVVLFFTIIALCVFNYKSKKLHNKLVESFEENSNSIELISDDDKTLYFSIIDTYELLLDRDPYEDELNLEFNDIKTNKSDLFKLHNKLKNSPEYRRLNDLQNNEAYAATDTNNDVQDYDAVVTILKETMPLVEEHEDPVHIEFLVMKYRNMEKDKSKLTKYIKKTPEYQDYLEIEKKSKKSKKSKTADEDSVNLLDKKTNVEFKISRPNLNSKTLKTAKKESKEFIQLIEDKLKKDNNMDNNEKGCDFYKEYQKLNSETMLSAVQKKRNLDKLKYHCDMSKMYSNLDSNLTLLSDQKWSVPQKHVPICGSQNCEINDTYSQSSLIGTLLNDVEFNSKLLPSFEYKENV